MKANEITPGTFLDLQGVRIPALMTGGMGKRYVPNWVRNVREARVYVYITLGDYRVLRVAKTQEMRVRDPYCLCGNRRFHCPQHSGFFIPQGEKRLRNNA